jgi:hypothetical protein
MLPLQLGSIEHQPLWLDSPISEDFWPGQEHKLDFEIYSGEQSIFKNCSLRSGEEITFHYAGLHQPPNHKSRDGLTFI